MATPQFITIRGSSGLTDKPYYIGLVQHEGTMTKPESYAYAASKIGYQPTAVSAAFLALAKALKVNADRGNISQLEGIASFRNMPKGSFDNITGPWVRGRNVLVVNVTTLDPFKSALAGVVPVNRTEGANPSISTVFDETTEVYGVITGTDTISVAGVDLAPDTTKDDEYVALVDQTGVETKAVISSSTLTNVRFAMAVAPAPGEYTLKIYTRSGLGEDFGVRVATRKVTVE